MTTRSTSEHGASSVEYALIAAAIAALVVAVAISLGIMSQSMFADSCTSVKAGYDQAGVSTANCT